jgi:hypothetical protein
MRVFGVAAVLLLWAGPALAQGAARLEQIDRQIEEIQELRLDSRREWSFGEGFRLLYGAYNTFSFLAADDDFSNTRIQRQYDTRLWAQGAWRGHELYGRLRFQYRDFNAGDSFDGEGDELSEPIGDRYWWRWRSRGAHGGEISRVDYWIQVGRQHVEWAQGITLSDTLFAVQGGIETRLVRVTGLLGQTPRHGTVDFDASRPQFDDDVDRRFWGVWVEYAGSAKHQPYAFYLDQTDENGTTGVVLAFPARWSYDSSYVGIGSKGSITGTLYYRFEFVWEFGDSITDPVGNPQTIEDIEAWALRFELSLTPRRWQRRAIRFEFELLLGSGDDDRGHSAFTVFGNQSGTDDESFNAFGYINTGLALGPELANLVSVRLTASGRPAPGSEKFKRLRLQLDVFIFSTLDDDAATNLPLDRGDGFIGMEADLSAEWQILSDLYLDLRYGVFFAGEALQNGFDDDRHFFYVGISYAF